MAQISLTLTDGGATVYVDDLSVVTFQANSTTGSLVYINSLQAGLQTLDVTESPSVVAAKSPLFIALTKVDQVNPNAAFSYSGLTGAFIGGEIVAFSGGGNAVVNTDTGSAMTVTTAVGANISNGQGMVGQTSGAVATVSGAATYTWQSSLSFYLNAARIVDFFETGANGTRTILYNDSFSPDANEMYVSESLSAIAAAAAVGAFVYVGGAQTISGTKTFNNLKITKGTVTQGTSITTGVTVNAAAGVITTVSAALAADASAEFTVTNSFCAASSVVLANIVDYAGTDSTNGIPVVKVDTIGAGSFKIVISNAHSANALSGVLKIGFIIV